MEYFSTGKFLNFPLLDCMQYDITVFNNFVFEFYSVTFRNPTLFLLTECFCIENILENSRPRCSVILYLYDDYNRVM